MTAAAITSSSFWTPRLVTAALSRAVWIAALTAHEDAHQGVREHHGAPGVDAAQLRRFRVAAVRVDVPAEATSPGEVASSTA